MEVHTCSVVPPHLLDNPAASDDSDTREMALNTVAHTSDIRARRKRHFDDRKAAVERVGRFPVLQSVVPDHFLEQVVSSDLSEMPNREQTHDTFVVKQSLRNGTAGSSDVAMTKPRLKLNRKIYDLENFVNKQGGVDVTFFSLPGKLVRSEREAPVIGVMVNEAYENCAKVLKFYHQVFDYTFLGDGDAPIISSVHYRVGYQNAQWIGENVRQMVYGDGGPELSGFTACLDIIGHEMTHAVTEHLCHLEYQGESGALNEHLSDVFGKMNALWDENKTSAESDWLIGERCFMPEIPGVALRNMKFPGSAYNDPKYGTDPQPASRPDMEAYKAKHTSWETYDHGSVHAFSGVPNRAFVLVAEALGGYCWDQAGRIWWRTILEHRISSTCSFVEFADATVNVAKELFGEDVAETVRNAWNEVGVKRQAL